MVGKEWGRGMLVHKEVVAIMVLEISMKCLVFMIYEGRDLTIGWRWALMYAETCSVGEKWEAMMGRPGLPGLWILGRK